MLGKNDLPLFKAILDRFAGKKILVIGDIMVDEYIWGKVTRISPEAPVPVVLVSDESIRLGGASNVVNNLRTLGAQVYLAGLVGDDAMGRKVISLLEERHVNTEGIVTNAEARTTLKTRIIAHSQQVVRVDRETVTAINDAALHAIVTFAQRIMPEIDAVIISDYAKGVVCQELAQEIINLCTTYDKFCTVDPKVPHMRYYQGCTVMTPNHHEAGQATGHDIRTMEDLKRVGFELKNMLRAEAVLITYGERGMVLFEEEGLITQIDTVARAVYDVTGAGDTVISTLTLALASGASMINAAILSNFAAGEVVAKVGTATVEVQEIIRSLTQYVNESQKKFGS